MPMPPEPIADRPAIPREYGVASGPEGMLPWASVEAQLAAAKLFWVATTNATAGRGCARRRHMVRRSDLRRRQPGDGLGARPPREPERQRPPRQHRRHRHRRGCRGEWGRRDLGRRRGTAGGSARRAIPVRPPEGRGSRGAGLDRDSAADGRRLARLRQGPNTLPVRLTARQRALQGEDRDLTRRLSLVRRVHRKALNDEVPGALARLAGQLVRGHLERLLAPGHRRLPFGPQVARPIGVAFAAGHEPTTRMSSSSSHPYRVTVRSRPDFRPVVVSLICIAARTIARHGRLGPHAGAAAGHRRRCRGDHGARRCCLSALRTAHRSHPAVYARPLCGRGTRARDLGARAGRSAGRRDRARSASRSPVGRERGRRHAGRAAASAACCCAMPRSRRPASAFARSACSRTSAIETASPCARATDTGRRVGWRTRAPILSSSGDSFERATVSWPAAGFGDRAAAARTVRACENIAMYTRYGYRETHRVPHQGTDLVFFRKRLRAGAD